MLKRSAIHCLLDMSHAPAMYSIGDDVIMLSLDAIMFLPLSDLVDTIAHRQAWCHVTDHCALCGRQTLTTVINLNNHVFSATTFAVKLSTFRVVVINSVVGGFGASHEKVIVILILIRFRTIYKHNLLSIPLCTTNFSKRFFQFFHSFNLE